MSKSRSTSARRAGVVLAILAALVLAALGCDKGQQQQQTVARKKPARYVVPAEFDRELNRFEVDSLRSMKETHGITRDEYWDGYGGVLASDAIEVWYPVGKVNVLQGVAMFKLAAEARQKVTDVFGRAPAGHAVIICSPNLEWYQYNTGRDWWIYSAIKGDTISVQAPIDLHTRGLLKIVGPREYYEWAIGRLSDGHAPRWVEEGCASYLAGEAVILEDQRQDFAALGAVAISPSETERVLAAEKDRRETRRAYYNAYRMIEELVKKRGETSMAEWVNDMATEPDLDAATRKAFNEDYVALCKEASSWAATEASP